MVICGIALDRAIFDKLRTERVRDSKKISPNRRETLAEFLREEAEKIEIEEFESAEIDELRKDGTNLNKIEAIGFARIIDKLDVDKAYLDSASANAESFKEKTISLSQKQFDLVVEHEADQNHLPVSAASIIAKVRRDARIEELKEEYGETGSGYPCDSKTISFLKEWMKNHQNLPNFSRKTWSTAQRIKSEFED